MMYDGLFCAFDQVAMGARHGSLHRSGRHQAGPPGRLLRQLARAGGGGNKGGRFADEIAP